MSNQAFKKMKTERFIQARRKIINNLARNPQRVDKSQEQKSAEEQDVLDAIANIDRRKKEIKERLIKEGYESDELAWINH